MGGKDPASADRRLGSQAREERPGRLGAGKPGREQIRAALERALKARPAEQGNRPEQARRDRDEPRVSIEPSRQPQATGIPIRVEVYASTKEIAEAQAEAGQRYLLEELMVMPQNLGTESFHASFSEQRVEVVLLNR